jgi:TP901-1 family phage major tail protein
MAFKGREILTKILIDSTYMLIAGLRSKTPVLNHEPADITCDESQGWREYLSNDGITSLSVSGTGVFQDDAGINAIEDLVYSGDHGTFQIIMPNGDIYEGLFQVTSLEYTGDHLTEQSYSITLENADDIVLTRV